MRSFCQICWSSHEEVMFRKVQDINYYFNCFALACLETESRPVCDSEMTTHCHEGVFSDYPAALFSFQRYPYTRYFNSEYGRKGQIGERKPYITEIQGFHHTAAFISYVFRQGLHHGLSQTPFGYPHNSVNAIFRKALGKEPAKDLIDRRKMSRFLPRSARNIPDNYRMNSSGLLLREDVIDTAYVEEFYITPRNFLYQMNRISNDSWKEDQAADNNSIAPVTLELVEPKCYLPHISRMLNNENARHYREHIDDLDLCSLIDNEYILRLDKKSIYELTRTERNDMANLLNDDFKNGNLAKLYGRDPGLPDSSQIKRCMAITLKP